MATLPVQDITRSGLNPSYVAASVSGDEFANDGSVYPEVVNGSGVSVTVTIVSQSTDDGLAVADRTVVVPAGERRKIGPFPKATYNVTSGASAGRVQMTYSAVTSVTVGVFRLTPVT